VPITTDDIRQSLLANDPEYKQLVEEHSRCETQLDEIIRYPYRNSEDLALETKLKKIKLHLRDQMELMVARRLNHTAHH
jgi:uncharacterized protein YdcH (DUF465 family)